MNQFCYKYYFYIFQRNLNLVQKALQDPSLLVEIHEFITSKKKSILEFPSDCKSLYVESLWRTSFSEKTMVMAIMRMRVIFIDDEDAHDVEYDGLDDDQAGDVYKKDWIHLNKNDHERKKLIPSPPL